MALESDSEEDIENLSRLFGLEKLRFNVVSAKIMPGSSSGDNFMSVVKRIVLIGLDANNKEKSLSLIIKRQIRSNSRRQLYRCDEAFSNEIAAYKEIVPMLEQHIQPKPFFPTCYFAGLDERGELIILEDLKEKKFAMPSRLHGLDLEHCQLVMKELAKLHAGSIGAKRAGFNEFRVKIDCLNDIVYCDDAEEFYTNVVESAVEQALDSLRTSNTDGSLTEAIRLIQLVQPKLYEKLKTEIWKQKAPNTVICHGDLWMNNMMFKTDPVTRKPYAVRFLDLQAMRYSSPVFDILHFIYTSTKRDLRDVHLKQILETYCLRIRWYIDQQSYPNAKKDLDSIKMSFTLQSITREFKQKILYGLAIAVWILPAVTFDPDNLPNLDLLSETNQQGKELKCTQKLTPEYHSRIKDLALEFYQNGFLNGIE